MPGLALRATAWACRRRALLKLAPPFSFLYVAIQQSGSSYPLSLLKRGVVRMLGASFMTSSMVRLARCKIFVSAQLIGWSFAHACSAMADLSVRYLVQASLCSFRRAYSRRFVSPIYTCSYAKVLTTAARPAAQSATPTQSVRLSSPANTTTNQQCKEKQ